MGVTGLFESFFQMTATPFARDIPAEDCYQSPASAEVLGRLVYAAQRQWFAVVTGDCGIGKSTTIRRLTATLDAGTYTVLYVADSKLTPRHFYKGLLEQLGYEAKFYRGDAKRQLHREIEIIRGVHGLHPVVVVDEAHLLDREMLEEVRFLLLCRTHSYAEWSEGGQCLKHLRRQVLGITIAIPGRPRACQAGASVLVSRPSAPCGRWLAL